MAVQIVADSTCDLSQKLIEQYHIHILPLTVSLNDTEYRDGIDLHAADIFRAVGNGSSLPKTAAVSVAVFADCFREILAEHPGDEILCITIGSKFSSCFQNASIAAEETGSVTAVDSCNLSTGFGHVVLSAAEYTAEGHTASETAAYLNAQIIPYVDASFIIDRLDYLRKGGRCSSVAALGANLLKLKPCIEVKNGEMHVAKKYRGNFVHCVSEYAKERLADRSSIRDHRIFVTHTDASPEAVKAAKDAVREAGGFELTEETAAGCTISCHCGPNTLGILFIRKPGE